jgi:two-component system, LytTR family, response regulator
MLMRALIIDDEPLARQGVSLRLQQFPGIEIAGECADGAQAVDVILETAPDLIFLDIQMPSMSGFEVLHALPQESIPATIFLTAYDRYALEAFDAHAVDYVLKPINTVRFSEAVTRALKMIDAGWKPQMLQGVLNLANENTSQYASRFTIHTGTKIQVVNTSEIDWIATARDYVELHVGPRVHLMRETMNSLEKRLDPKKFLRVHRSRIVRMDRVAELRSIENREFILVLSDGSEHRSSRTYADQLARWLNSPA